VAVVVNGPVLVRGVRGHRRARDRVDGLFLGQVGGVAAEAALERITAAVRQEGRHAGSAQACGGRVVECVVAVVVLGVAVDALALGLAPADAPGAVAGRRGNGDDALDVVAAEVGKFQHQHAAHGAADDGGDLAHAEVVQDELEDVDIVSDRRQGELGAVQAEGGVAVLGGDGAGAAVRTAQAVHTHDEEARRVEGLARAAQQRAPPVAHVGAPGEGMADDHGIVAGRREGAIRLVRDGHMEELDAGFERDAGEDSAGLVGNQAGKRALGLR